MQWVFFNHLYMFEGIKSKQKNVPKTIKYHASKINYMYTNLISHLFGIQHILAKLLGNFFYVLRRNLP